MKIDNLHYDEIWTSLYVPQLGNDIWVSSYGKIIDNNGNVILRCANAFPKSITVVLGDNLFDVAHLIIKAFNIDNQNIFIKNRLRELFEYIWDNI